MSAFQVMGEGQVCVHCLWFLCSDIPSYGNGIRVKKNLKPIKKQLENTYALVTPSLGEAVWTGCANDEDYELQGRESVLWVKQLT